MYDSLIKFLQQQLELQKSIQDRQSQMIVSMTTFLQGLTQPPADVGAHHRTPVCAVAREGSSMVCTRRQGAFALWEHKREEGGDAQHNDAIKLANNTASMPTDAKEDIDMKYVTKRSDGRYMARKTIEGKRVVAYGHSKKEAIDTLHDIIGKRRYNKRGSMTLTKFALWWLDTYKQGNVSDKTYMSYLSAIKAHIKLDMPLNKITVLDLQQLINDMPLSKQRKEVYKLIKQIFRKAYELDYVKKDVSEFVELGKIVGKHREALGLDDQRKLWNALGDDMFSRRVRFYLLTGARPAEIATVNKDELRPGWVKLNGTKTENAVRWVKISNKLYESLLGESPEFFKFDNKRFRQRLQRFAQSCGIEKNIDVYTLRHTFATNLYLLRIPEKDRQTYMGHAAGSDITNTVYTTFTPDTRPQDIIDIFGDWLPEF